MSGITTKEDMYNLPNGEGDRLYDAAYANLANDNHALDQALKAAEEEIKRLRAQRRVHRKQITHLNRLHTEEKLRIDVMREQIRGGMEQNQQMADMLNRIAGTFTQTDEQSKGGPCGCQ